MGQIEYFNKTLAKYRVTSSDDNEGFRRDQEEKVSDGDSPGSSIGPDD